VGPGVTRALLFALALAACSSAPAPVEATPLAGSRWVMVFPPDYAPDEAPPTLEFEADRAAGFAGCNRWFASVAQRDESISFGDVGLTRMACPRGAMSVERHFTSILSAARHAQRGRDILVLLDADRQPLARFERLN
jgi:heat shock protein HslJ